MSTRKSSAKEGVSAEVLSFFNDPPLLATENRQAYFDLLSNLLKEFCPKHVFGRLLLNNVVDQSWEVRRLILFKVELIEAERARRIEAVKHPYDGPSIPLLSFGPPDPPPKPVSKATIRRKRRQRILELSARRGSTEAFLATLTEYERIDRLLASAQARLTMLIREVQLYLQDLSPLLERASTKIIEGEYDRAAE